MNTLNLINNITKVYNYTNDIKNKICDNINNKISDFIYNQSWIKKSVYKICIKIHNCKLKTYPYRITIDSKIDIIGSFALVADHEYSTETLEFVKTKIKIISLEEPPRDTPVVEHEDGVIPVIYTVSIRPNILNNFDFYVYSKTFNDEFVFCFKDKKQFAKFKLKYG